MLPSPYVPEVQPGSEWLGVLSAWLTEVGIEEPGQRLDSSMFKASSGFEQRLS